MFVRVLNKLLLMTEGLGLSSTTDDNEMSVSGIVSRNDKIQ